MIRAARKGPQRALSAAVVALIIGGFVTAALSWAVHTIDSHNENRLLRLQVQTTAAVIQAALPNTQTPLTSAASVASGSKGDVDAFRSFLAPSVGPRPLPFVSASLWRVDGSGPRSLSTLGAPSELPEQQALVSRAAASLGLLVAGPYGPSPRGLAYAISSGNYVVYAESVVGPRSRLATQPNSPFAVLHYALYLGRTTDSENLLQTDLNDVPITGRKRTVTVPFGDNTLTLVARPAGHIAGGFSQRLWWIAALVGTGITLAAAGSAARLTHRRKLAEELSDRVQVLLGEQRNISSTLQHALLPQELPQVEGVEFAVRYLPGVDGVDIGGDWYDVVRLDDHRFFFAVGDVSGRGLAAGTVMASLRFAIRGFAVEGHDPATVLRIVQGLLDLKKDGHFATVLCGVADTRTRTISLASAGHLPPLLMSSGDASFVDVAPGTPIGVAGAVPLMTTVEVARGDTFLVYTDGLVERRGWDIDTRLEQFRTLVVTPGLELSGLVSLVIDRLSDGSTPDDTALLGMRWLN